MIRCGASSSPAAATSVFAWRKTLEKANQVKLIERDARRARRIAELLENAIVLHGDAADEELLIEENIDSTDVFAALTNSEEANILSAMLAKRLGATKVMALINKPSYAELMESSSIDIAISPQTITIGSLLAHVRRGDVVRVHALKRGSAEALEAIVHGDDRSSRVVGRMVEQIPLPEGASIGAIVRGDEVIMAHHDTVVQADDHVILFLSDRRHLEAVERLFLRSTALSAVLAVAHVLGLLLATFALTYVLPVGCSLLLGDGLWPKFLLAAAITAGAGLVLAGATMAFRRELKPRDGFLLVTLGWLLLSAAAALPLLLVLPRLNFTDAFFETMSGLTTTGSTVLNGLDQLPPSLNFWRHALHWFGGLGIIVMALAVLPLLGVGGMQLYKGQTPGPVKDERLAPRITETAKSLWLVYALITAAGSWRCASAACPGSMPSATPSRRSGWAVSRPTTAASPTSTPRRSSWC